MLTSTAAGGSPMVSGVLGGFLSLLSLTWVVPIPGLAQAPTVSPSLVINNTQVSNYARAVLAIEPIRLKYYRQAQQLFPGRLPRNPCLGNSKDTIPTGLEGICQQYMNESMAILRKHDLTPEEFNAITQQLRFSPSLYQRVQLEMMRHQQP